jgi:ribosomal protein S18 acetylase RimI-like enzyme
MRMSCSIRQMTIDDYDEVYRLWGETEGLSLEEGDSRHAIELYLNRNQGFCFVATIQGRIIGTALCGHDGRRGILRHLVVDPTFRGRRVARSLVTECLSSLARAGITKCNTFVLDSNVEAQRFWERMGWYLLEDNYRTIQTVTKPKE